MTPALFWRGFFFLFLIVPVVLAGKAQASSKGDDEEDGPSFRAYANSQLVEAAQQYIEGRTTVRTQRSATLTPPPHLTSS